MVHSDLPFQAHKLIDDVKLTPVGLKWAPEELRSHRGVVLACVQANWECLEFAPHVMLADREVILAAVRQKGGGRALQWAAPKFRSDQELAALAKYGQANSPGAGQAWISFSSEGGVGAGLRYSWRSSRILEVESPVELGRPTAELFNKPSAGHVFGGPLLRLLFVSNSSQCPGKAPVVIQLQLPLDLRTCTPLVRMATCKAAPQPREKEQTAQQRRYVSDVGRLCTLEELHKIFCQQYTAQEINEYWEDECELLPTEFRPECQSEQGPEPPTLWEVHLPDGSGDPQAQLSIVPDFRTRAQATGTLLKKKSWAVMDGFLSSAEADAMHVLVQRLLAEKRLKAGEVGGGMQAPDKRGDLISVAEETVLPEALDIAQQRILILLKELSGSVPALSTGPIESEPPMLACYPGGGARYVRHYDCMDAQRSKFTQQRLCTLILYLNPFWDAAHGGCLRLYPGLPGKEEDHVDVAPLHGRLLAFLCEGQNAHEVLPAWRPRFACTWWVREAEVSLDAWEAMEKEKQPRPAEL